MSSLAFDTIISKSEFRFSVAREMKFSSNIPTSGIISLSNINFGTHYLDNTIYQCIKAIFPSKYEFIITGKVVLPVICMTLPVSSGALPASCGALPTGKVSLLKGKITYTLGQSRFTYKLNSRAHKLCRFAQGMSHLALRQNHYTFKKNDTSP